MRWKKAWRWGKLAQFRHGFQRSRNERLTEEGSASKEQMYRSLGSRDVQEPAGGRGPRKQTRELVIECEVIFDVFYKVALTLGTQYRPISKAAFNTGVLVPIHPSQILTMLLLLLIRARGLGKHVTLCKMTSHYHHCCSP